MRRTAIGIALFAACIGAVLAAQLYRWVDEKGNVEWRDTPPPPAAKKIEQRNMGGSVVPSAELPYSVQQAAKNFPVTLWTTDCGDTCAKARAHLARRGVPYTEKDPRNDFESFKKLTEGAEVPVLFVGGTRLKGYLESDWDAALDTAGYPKTALVKPQPKVEPKPATPEPGAPADKGAPAPTKSEGVKLYTTADCGLNCTSARQLLGARGVSFQEISVVEPPQIEELKKMTGDTVVPVLLLGQFWVQGYNPTDYDSALDKAGYKREPVQ